MAFKFHVERGAGPREVVDYWKDNLTSVRTYTMYLLKSREIWDEAAICSKCVYGFSFEAL